MVISTQIQKYINIMAKFMKCMFLMVISSCCFSMTTIAIINYHQLVYNTSDGMVIFVITGVFISGVISAYEFIKGFNELFCK